MSQSQEVAAALRIAEEPQWSAGERAEMLTRIAMGVQAQAQREGDLRQALKLYDRAHDLLPATAELERARLQARRATVFQVMPCADTTHLETALDLYAAVLPLFEAAGEPAERAELQLNRGLTLQALAGQGRAKMTDAIRAYQQALKIFTAADYPQEYAILHNNLATAFLSLPTQDPQGKMREALAVQSFEAALEVVTLESQPLEYAMLQNNLGNALQHVDSTHPVENHQRALAAYDEALRVRTRERSPVQFANTLANRAACCARLGMMLQDESTWLEQARAGYREAAAVFAERGETQRAELVAAALADLPAAAA